MFQFNLEKWFRKCIWIFLKEFGNKRLYKWYSFFYYVKIFLKILSCSGSFHVYFLRNVLNFIPFFKSQHHCKVHKICRKRYHLHVYVTCKIDSLHIQEMNQTFSAAHNQIFAKLFVTIISVSFCNSGPLKLKELLRVLDVIYAVRFIKKIQPPLFADHLQ